MILNFKLSRLKNKKNKNRGIYSTCFWGGRRYSSEDDDEDRAVTVTWRLRCVIGGGGGDGGVVAVVVMVVVVAVVVMVVVVVVDKQAFNFYLTLGLLEKVTRPQHLLPDDAHRGRR